MATPRRRIIRPPTISAPPDLAQQRRRQKLNARLQTARTALERWWKRLRRAMSAVEKHHKTVKSLERQLAQDQENRNGQSH
jgi:hypothetical protein